MSAGTLTSPVEELPVLFAPTVKGALDANTRISSITNIDTELPNGIRTEGYLYYVEDEDEIYIFKGGILNEDFKKLADVINSNSTSILKLAVDLVEGENLLIHNINTLTGKTDYTMVFEINNQTTYMDFKDGDLVGNDLGNKSVVTSLINVNGVVVKIIS